MNILPSADNQINNSITSKKELFDELKNLKASLNAMIRQYLVGIDMEISNETLSEWHLLIKQEQQKLKNLEKKLDIRNESFLL